jgi:hypothetical protein
VEERFAAARSPHTVAAPVITFPGVVEPHGGRLVDRIAERPERCEALDDIVMTEREADDLDMIACGALSPLEGFMGREDYDCVLEEMRLADGLPWTLPVCLASARAPRGDRVLLREPSGEPVGVLDVPSSPPTPGSATTTSRPTATSTSPPTSTGRSGPEACSSSRSSGAKISRRS